MAEKKLPGKKPFSKGPVENPIKFRISCNVPDDFSVYQTLYQDPITLLSTSKKGLAAKAALDFLKLSGFSAEEFQNTFKTSVKTIQNYFACDLKLDASLSEKLLKSFALFEKGVSVFGSARGFQSWLIVPAYGLGNQIPLALMATGTGIRLIEEELLRIQAGDLRPMLDSASLHAGIELTE